MDGGVGVSAPAWCRRTTVDGVADGGGRRRVGFRGWSGEVMAAWDFEWQKGGDGRG